MAESAFRCDLRVTFRVLAAGLGAVLVAAAAPAPPAPKVLAPSEIVAAAPPSDWVAIAPSDLLVMDLAADRDGNPSTGSRRRVVIQLMPPQFSQGWVGNIRKLAAAHWWDGLSINRVQDNYVVQWGDADGQDKVKAKKLPDGLVNLRGREYVESRAGFLEKGGLAGGATLSKVLLPRNDISHFSSYFGGFPIEAAASPDAVSGWPVHCYGMVGVGRDLSPDTGTGAELYTVIGHAPRHLDRNIALVGRVIAGIEQLSSLPRGTGPLGFYEKPEQRVTITSIRLGNEVTGLPRYQYLSTESASFAKYADARANRRDAFFIVPAGGADICNIPVPVRVAP